ncbi:MAG: hypothetical protein IJ352_07825 [Muribaculaceae bacterium]|nr:hypothetical protein [Muribaculaceae bacterium]
MKQKLLHFLFVIAAIITAIPIANAADYNYSSPTKAWAHSETTYSSRYYSIAVSEDNIFTLPSVSSTGTGMYSTYYTKGLRFSSSGVVAFSGGSGSYAFPNGSSGSYYYLGPATASDSKGTFIAATRRAGTPDGFGWASNVQSVAYYTSNPSSDNLNHTKPVAGSKEPINFSSTPISGRTDKMSAYGDVANGTGYLWFIPGNANNSYVGVERITTTSSGTVTSKRQWPFPSAITNIDNNTSRIMQYSNNCVLLDVHNKNFFKGIISNDHETITWTDLGIKASEGTGAAMFILGNHEILAYTSSSTQVTLYDVTDKKTISTFSPFSSASSVSSTRHAIDVRVSGNTANIYVLVPGQGAGKWTMTATPITSAVTSHKAALASGSTSVVNVTWGKPSQGTATKYAISY